MHLWRSQTRVPFSCFFTSQDGKKSQGERSGQHSGCKQLHLALFERVNRGCCCVRTGTVMTKKKATQSRQWAALAPNFEHLPALGDSDARTSPQWLSTCPHEELWPDFPKKEATVFFHALWEFFGMGTRLETARPPTASLVSGYYRLIKVSSSVGTSHVNFQQPPLNFRFMN